MNFVFLIIFCILLTVYSDVYTFPRSRQEVPFCFDKVCPPNTVRCKKLLKPKDSGTLHKTITCLDKFGKLVKEYYFEASMLVQLNVKAESVVYCGIGQRAPLSEDREIESLLE